jgi:hypothetical protein
MHLLFIWVVSTDDLDYFDSNALRRVNGYWSWRPNKQLAELGAARTILEAAGLSVARLTSRTHGEDPPDCEGIVDGASVGIEVTELVHQGALEQSLKDRTVYFVWDQQALSEAIQEIVTRKSEAQWQGGPYARRLLVVYTDEFVLNGNSVERFLEGQRFRTTSFSDAFLGLSYDPFSQSHPTFRLTLDRA